jgi:hypothetical protein
VEEIPGRLVIRSHAPARRWLMVSVGLLLLVALYLAFEGGRYRGGYDAVRSVAERNALQNQVQRLEQDTQALRVQLAAAQEAQVVDARERAALARTIGELQAQVERQQQDVEFYRGLLAPKLGQTIDTAIRVQQFHIMAMPVAQQFTLRFTLSRMTQPERPIDGTLAITVTGSQGATSGTVDLAHLTGGTHDVPFNFRYFTNIEQLITLPVAFKPNSVTIEIRPTRKDMAPYRQTFPWEVDPI